MESLFYIGVWLAMAIATAWGGYRIAQRPEPQYAVGFFAVFGLFVLLSGDVHPIGLVQRLYVLKYGVAGQGMVTPGLDPRRRGEHWATLSYITATEQPISALIPIGRRDFNRAQPQAIHYVPAHPLWVVLDDDHGSTVVTAVACVVFIAVILGDQFLQRRRRRRIESMQIWPRNH